MLKYSFFSVLLVAITVVIHAVGTTQWLRHLSFRFADGAADLNRTSQLLRIVVGTIFVLTILHTLQIIVWALAFLYMLPPDVLASFEEAIYFSFVTFTTLGYGDIVLTEVWRIFSGVEALNGVLLIGWSTAMLFAVVQRVWKDMLRQDASNNQ